MIYCSYPPVVTGPFITHISGKNVAGAPVHLLFELLQIPFSNPEAEGAGEFQRLITSPATRNLLQPLEKTAHFP